jgi:hypothetical protein
VVVVWPAVVQALPGRIRVGGPVVQLQLGKVKGVVLP